MIKNKIIINFNSNSNRNPNYCKELFSKKMKPSIFMNPKLILFKIIMKVINKKCTNLIIRKKLKEENDKFIIKVNSF